MEKFDLWDSTQKLQNENELDVDYDDVLQAIKVLGIKPEVPDDEHKSCDDESDDLITVNQFATIAEYLEFNEDAEDATEDEDEDWD